MPYSIYYISNIHSTMLRCTCYLMKLTFTLGSIVGYFSVRKKYGDRSTWLLYNAIVTHKLIV